MTTRRYPPQSRARHRSNTRQTDLCACPLGGAGLIPRRDLSPLAAFQAAALLQVGFRACGGSPPDPPIGVGIGKSGPAGPARSKARRPLHGQEPRSASAPRGAGILPWQSACRAAILGRAGELCARPSRLKAGCGQNCPPHMVFIAIRGLQPIPTGVDARSTWLPSAHCWRVAEPTATRRPLFAPALQARKSTTMGDASGDGW